MNPRRITAIATAATMLAAPIALAGPAQAIEKDINVGGADANFEVQREDGGYKVDVDIQHATPGSRWRITLWHDGQRFFRDVRRADGDGDVNDVERQRRNTRGSDVFKVRIKRIGGDSAVRRIRRR